MKERIGILAQGDTWHVQRLGAALDRLGCDAVPLPAARLASLIGAGPTVRGAGPGSSIRAGDCAVESLDALLVRFIPPGSLDQIVFRMDLLHVLHDSGLPVVNPPRAVERTVDKHWTSRLLQDAGIPTPRTVAAESFDDAMAAFAGLGDVLVKPLFGSGGRGIVRVGDPDLAYRTFRALEMQRAVFYIQEFVPHGRSDLRFFVAGGRVIAAARRTGNGWKTNAAAGARMEHHRPDPIQEDLALRSAGAVGADYAGVDLIEAEDGRVLVVEVNGIPGWSGLQSTTSIDLAQEVAVLARSRLAARRAAASMA